MYFKAIPFKKQKPKTSYDRKVVILNPKTRDIKTVHPGRVPNWEYLTSDWKYTHWLKKIKNPLITPPIHR